LYKMLIGNPEKIALEISRHLYVYNTEKDLKEISCEDGGLNSSD